MMHIIDSISTGRWFVFDAAPRSGMISPREVNARGAICWDWGGDDVLESWAEWNASTAVRAYGTVSAIRSCSCP